MSAYVKPRTDQTEHGEVDGVVPAFNATVEAGAGGFGVRTTVKGVEVFEVLDAMPLNRQATQLAVELGSKSAEAVQSGVALVDFATTENFLTTAEAAAAKGIKAGEASAGDLT